MSTHVSAAQREAGAAGGYPRRWLAAAAMMAAVLMDMIDVTIVNVALPTIRHDWGPARPSSNGWCRPTCWPSRPC